MATMVGAAYVYVARLTMTYHDVFGRKHATIADLDSLQRWHLAEPLEGSAVDLEDLERASSTARVAAIQGAQAVTARSKPGRPRLRR